jgi:hypothetical protein
MVVATYSPQARNIARNMYDMSGEEGEGRNMEKVFATWEKVFATWKEFSQHGKRCSQHSQHASQHHDPTANMFPDSNRVAGNVSDAIARIGRLGASSSVNFISFCWYLWPGLPDVSTQLFQQIGCLAILLFRTRIKQYQCNFICLTDMTCSIFRQLNSIFTHSGTGGFYFLGVCAQGSGTEDIMLLPGTDPAVGRAGLEPPYR